MLLHAGLAVFGHDVTARDLDLGAFTLTIATGDLYHGMAHVRGVVEGHRLGVKVQVAQHTTEPRRQIDGEFGVGKSPLVKSSLVQDHRQSLDVVLVRRVGFHELQPALHQVLHREVGARPQKHAHIRVLAVVVEAQTHLLGKHIAPDVQQQELEQSHFPYFINRPHLWETYSKIEGCVQSGNRTSCALLTRVMHHLCETIARVRPDLCRMECSSHWCFFSALGAGSGDGQEVSDICRCGHTFEVGRGLLLKYVTAPSLSCSSHDVHLH